MSVIMRGVNQLMLVSDPFADLPLAQFRLLRAVGRGVETPSLLADYLATSVSAVTQIANRLEAHGLVERAEDAGDRRVRRLRLSAKGMRAIKERNALRVAGAERILGSLSDDDRAAVMHGIELLKSACLGARPAQGADSLAFLAEVERGDRHGEDANR